MHSERNLEILVTALLLAVLPWPFTAAPAAAQEPVASTAPAFTTIFEHYEAVREALFLGGTVGVAGHAEALAAETEVLERSFTAELPEGIGDAAEVRQLLPEIRREARLLASAVDLEQARRALAELTKPLVRWRKLLSGDGLPVVVYCPMSQKAWLQPEGAEVTNPYHGESMARCGDVVLQ